jgi:hypothetical protein
MRSDTDTRRTSGSSPSRDVRRKWIAAAAAVAAMTGVSATALAVTRGSDNDHTGHSAYSQQIPVSYRVCQQRLDDYPPSTADGPVDGWCNDFGNWMFDQMSTGSMRRTMMWYGPAAMIDACHQWIGTPPGSDATASNGASATNRWCNQMITWMTEHMGDWDDRNGHTGDGPWDTMMHR